MVIILPGNEKYSTKYVFNRQRSSGRAWVAQWNSRTPLIIQPIDKSGGGTRRHRCTTHTHANQHIRARVGQSGKRDCCCCHSPIICTLSMLNNTYHWHRKQWRLASAEWSVRRPYPVAKHTIPVANFISYLFRRTCICFQLFEAKSWIMCNHVSTKCAHENWLAEVDTQTVRRDHVRKLYVAWGSNCIVFFSRVNNKSFLHSLYRS